jgi:hypothetical protein
MGQISLAWDLTLTNPPLGDLELLTNENPHSTLSTPAGHNWLQHNFPWISFRALRAMVWRDCGGNEFNNIS